MISDPNHGQEEELCYCKAEDISSCETYTIPRYVASRSRGRPSHHTKESHLDRTRNRTSPKHTSTIPASNSRSSRCWVHLLLLLSVARIALGEQVITSGPFDATAVEGATIVLQCMVQGKVGPLQWTKDAFGLGTDRELRGFPRYSMIGDDPSGNFSLRIVNVRLEDDGEYQCQVGAMDGVRGVRSNTARLTVQVPPEPPSILRPSPHHSATVREGVSQKFECEARGGRPPAELEWIDSSGNVLRSGITLTKEPFRDNKRETARLVYSFTPSKNDNGKTLKCRSRHPTQAAPIEVKINLEVKYPPDVNVTVKPDKITEMDTVTFTCNAVANPMDLIYKWYRQGQIIPGNHTTSLTLKRISREYDKNVISCEVKNSMGTITRGWPLNVTYGPRFAIQPAVTTANEGEDVRLECNVQSNPEPRFMWKKEGSSEVLSIEKTFIITDIKAEKAGKYYCRAVAKGFPEAYGEYTVFLNGPPVIRSTPIQYGSEGSTIRIECEVHAVPSITGVSWQYEGKEIDIDRNTRYAINEATLVDGSRHFLIIYESRASDFGSYNCTVTNNFGSAIQTITLQRQTLFPLMMLLAGVIGGITIVVAITIVIVLAVRKFRSKPPVEPEPEKQSKSSEHSSNDSDLKVEVRTSSSLSNNDSEPWEAGSIESAHHHHLRSDGYRYGSDYIDPKFPPNDNHAANGYISYVDYQRDYNPPPAPEPGLGSLRQSLYTSPGGYGSTQQLDPRYQAAYANPYLRTQHSQLPPPQVYNNGPMRTNLQDDRGGSQHYITAPSQAQLRPGTLATHV